MTELISFDPGRLFSEISGNLLDILLYSAIGIVTLIGFFKCIFPVQSISHELRRATGRLEKGTNHSDENGRPEWQSPSFLGKRLEGAWRRFLANAKQLDARGLTCDVCDYINDDTTIYAVGHAQLAEIIPSLLTSLGILGTFIGLASGLGKLRIQGDNMMETIPGMINGMSFAFMTSIVGVACSLCFNIINRMVSGSAVNAIDDFQDAFSGIVMQRPVADSVRMIIQQEDQAQLLRHSIGDLSGRVAEGVSTAVKQSLDPVAMTMNQFIAGQTQSQLEGLNMITGRFIENMSGMMGNGLLQLGQTLSRVTAEQQLSLSSLNESLSTAGRMLDEVKMMQNMTERVGSRLEKMLAEMEKTGQSNSEFLLHGSEVLNGMVAAAAEQGSLISSLTDSQRALENSMRDYGEWTQRTLNMVQLQSENTVRSAGETAANMEHAALELKNTYAALVGNFGEGMTRCVDLFDKNVEDLNRTLHETAEVLKQRLPQGENANSNGKAVKEYVSGMAGLQQTVGEFKRDFEQETHKITTEGKHA